MERVLVKMNRWTTQLWMHNDTLINCMGAVRSHISEQPEIKGCAMCRGVTQSTNLLALR